VNLPPLDLGALVGQSQARPGVLAVVLMAAAAYLLGASRTPGWPVARTAAFLGGLLVIVLATCTGIEAYGHVLEWMHMIEHLLLIMIAPVLLALGSPLALVPGLAPFLRRPVVAWLTAPAAAAAYYTVAVIGVHLTGLMDRAMTDPAVHTTEELIYLGSGFLLFQLCFGSWPGRWQLTGAGRMTLLALITPVDTVVGVVLLQTGTVQGGLDDAGHGHARPDWALSAAADTVAAGTTMWIGGTGIMAAFMLAIGLTWLHGRPSAQTAPTWTEQVRRSVHAERTGTDSDDIDDDEAALEAYNRWLARMHERDG
jgi:cytochrome c oxidase assembly factor CtaG